MPTTAKKPVRRRRKPSPPVEAVHRPFTKAEIIATCDQIKANPQLPLLAVLDCMLEMQRSTALLLPDLEVK